MALNERDWRPITFQGVTFPVTLMGIDILEPVLGFADEELGAWLWRLTICCGMTRRAPAEQCARCARKAMNLMLERRQCILDGIQERLGPRGFDSETTYRDWILSLQRIVELSESAEGNCVWSAPAHPQDNRISEAEAQRRLAQLRAEALRGEL